MSRCILCENGVPHSCHRTPTPERPTTEEGEEELAKKWASGFYRDREFFCSKGTAAYEGYLAGLRGGKRLGQQYDKDFLRECSNYEAQLVSAQEEVRKLKEGAEILFNFEKQNLQLQQEIASLRAENAEVRNLRRDWERISDQHKAESTRLRELVKVAEGALDYVERRTDPEQKNPTEHHFIRSTRLRGVAVAALARLRSGKDGGKNG